MCFCEPGVHLGSSPICRARHRQQSHGPGTETEESQMEIISNVFTYEVVLLCFALSKVEKVYNCIQVVFGIRNCLLQSCPAYLCLLLIFTGGRDGVVDAEVFLPPAVGTSWEMGWKTKWPLGDVGDRWCHRCCQEPQWVYFV